LDIGLKDTVLGTYPASWWSAAGTGLDVSLSWQQSESYLGQTIVINAANSHTISGFRLAGIDPQAGLIIKEIRYSAGEYTPPTPPVEDVPEPASVVGLLVGAIGFAVSPFRCRL
jgi:hypothetical protein